MKNFISKLFKAFGIFMLRYGLGFVILWLGFLKFKNSEAIYTSHLISSGYISWVLKYITPYALNQLIAYLQIAIGICLMLKHVSRTLSFWGSIAAVIIFGISISLLFSSEYVWLSGYGFPELSKAGQAILKDFILLGAASWCVGDSL